MGLAVSGVEEDVAGEVEGTTVICGVGSTAAVLGHAFGAYGLTGVAAPDFGVER